MGGRMKATQLFVFHGEEVGFAETEHIAIFTHCVCFHAGDNDVRQPGVRKRCKQSPVLRGASVIFRRGDAHAACMHAAQ